MSEKFKIGDWVKYKIIDRVDAGGDGSITEEGESEIIGITESGGIEIDSESGLIALPSECEKISPKYNIKDFVQRGIVEFDSYRAGFFYYNVERNAGTFGTYQFQIPIEDIGNATLLNQDKAITFMRWIRKSIENGTLNRLYP